jgi:invasion protein IalB
MNKAAILSALLVTSAAAYAQAESEAPATTKLGPNQDPNQVVCQTQTEIGSRLNRRRVCRTRAEWAEHQRMYRQSIERAQTQKQSSNQ